MEALDSENIDLYKLRVNSYTKGLRTRESGVENMNGSMKVNILDNSYFGLHDPDERAIFVVGTSVATGFPPIKFSYKGHRYRIYNFAITGNPLYPSMKILSIISEFKPFAVFFALTPVQLESSPIFYYDPFGYECLGEIQNYDIPNFDYSSESKCRYSKTQVRDFSFKESFRNAYKLLAHPFANDEKFDRRLTFLRATLASGFGDAADVFFRNYSSVKAKGFRPEVDLGELTGDNVRENQKRLLKQIDEMPNTILPNSKHGADEKENWLATKPIESLNPHQAMDVVYSSIGRFAKKNRLNVLFYLSPIEHRLEGIFPKGYFELYRKTMTDFFVRENLAYVDKADVLHGKGKLKQDFLHLNFDGAKFFGTLFIYDAIANGFFDQSLEHEDHL